MGCSCRTFREEPLGTPVSLLSGALLTYPFVSPTPEGSRDPALGKTRHTINPRRGSRFATAIERPQGPDTLLTAHLLESPKLQAPPAPGAGLLFVGPLGTPPGGPALA